MSLHATPSVNGAIPHSDDAASPELAETQPTVVTVGGGDPGPKPNPRYHKSFFNWIPAELKALKQWVTWKYVIKEDANGKKSWSKAPYWAKAPKYPASHSNPRGWGTFEQAMGSFAESRASGGDVDGIGFVFTKDDPYTGVDLDDCLVPTTGELLDWAKPHVAALNGGFIDVSPSGTGLKVFVRAKLKGPGTKRTLPGGGAIEAYCETRYFTTMGCPFDRQVKEGEQLDLIIPDRQEAIDALYDHLCSLSATSATSSAPIVRPDVVRYVPSPGDMSDEDLLRIARNNRKTGRDFAALYDYGDTSSKNGDASAADYALCKLLAFWTNRDTNRMDALFRRSALMRDKFDERRGDSTYGWDTVVKAARACTNGFVPKDRPAVNVARASARKFEPPADEAGVIAKVKAYVEASDPAGLFGDHALVDDLARMSAALSPGWVEVQAAIRKGRDKGFLLGDFRDLITDRKNRLGITKGQLRRRGSKAKGHRGYASLPAKLVDNSPHLRVVSVDDPAESDPRPAEVTPDVQGDEASSDDMDEGYVVHKLDDPFRLATLFKDRGFSHRSGCTLVYHQDEFHRWLEGGAYRVYHDFLADMTGAIESDFQKTNKEAVADYVQACRKKNEPIDPDELPEKQKVTRNIVNDAINSLKSLTVLSWDSTIPCWIEDDESLPDPLSILPVTNGLLNLDTTEMSRPTANFFSPFALSYAYQKDAPEPARWVQFLSELWPDDPDSIRELQKWFGLCLTMDTRYQKILVLIGDPRCGKGTVIRILERMLGEENIHSANMAALGGRFGLEPLINKTVAIFKDNRDSGHGEDKMVALERMLQIAGEDRVSIDRKGIKAVERKLFTRLMMVSNQLPNIRDTSGAWAARTVPLKINVSFLGREDITLTDTLYGEMSGILNWAIEGLRLLKKDGGFTSPETAKSLVASIRDITSPMKQFVEDYMEDVQPNTLLPTDHDLVSDVHLAYREWCFITSHQCPCDSVFSRNLQATFGTITAKRVKMMDGTNKARLFGKRLNSEGRKLSKAAKRRMNIEVETGKDTASPY